MLGADLAAKLLRRLTSGFCLRWCSHDVDGSGEEKGA
jgi:hypothetical protein